MRWMWSILKRLHKDEGGSEGLEWLLIVAVIVLPLLGLLIYFRGDIAQWARDMWNKIKSDANQPV